MKTTARLFGSCLWVVTVILAATSSAPLALGQIPRPQLAPLVVSLDWKMAERFRDLNGNGLVDVPNTRQYVRGVSPRNCPSTDLESPPTFCVELSARYKAWDPELASLLSSPLPVRTTYRWRLLPTEAVAAAEQTTTAPRWVVPLPEGRFRVEVELTLEVSGMTETASSAREIQVDDILIVSMGDSLSSGEANPEAAALLSGEKYPQHVSRFLNAAWADDGSSPFFATEVSKDHHRSHRTTASWPARAALKIERSDPHTSVTFVHVAASGATIRKVGKHQREAGGLLEPYAGVEHDNVFRQKVQMKPQIDQVAELLGCLGGPDGSERFAAMHCDRQIDALTISIGINDIKFAKLIERLVLADYTINGLDYEDAREAAIRDAENRLRGLPKLYDELAAAIRKKLNVFLTYLIEYPDPTRTRNEDGDAVYCDEIVGDILPPLLEVDKDEQKRSVKRVLIPLNQTGRLAAGRHGWVYVGGIADGFGLKGHGYCAPDHRRWFRTATESAGMQGPDAACALGHSPRYPACVIPAKKATKGTIHPLGKGHSFMAGTLRSALVLQSPNSTTSRYEDDDQLAEAVGIPVTQPAEKDHCEYAGAYPCALFNTDVDIYRVTISGRNQRMTFRAEARASGLKPQLRLFDSAGADITRSATCVGVSSSAECPAQVSSFTLTFREAGTYYVGASAWGNDRYDPVSGLGDRPGTSAKLYSLRAFTISGVPDNTLAHANPASLDERVEGYAVETKADVDMFRFHADSAGDVHVDVKSSVRGSAPSGLPGLPAAVVVLQPGRFSARLFDRTGNELARGEEPFTHRLPSAGDYYLGVASADATYDPTVGVAQPAGQGRPPGGYVLSLTRGSSAPEKDPEPAPVPVEPEEPPAKPEEPPDEDEDRTLPPRPEVRPNQPPSVRDGYVKLPRASCVRICVWHIWLEPGDVADPEGDDWAVHSWNHSRRLASLSFGECGYDEHGCFRYSTLLTGPYEDSFTFRVWDEDGSGRPSEKATVRLCVNCR